MHYRPRIFKSEDGVFRVERLYESPLTGATRWLWIADFKDYYEAKRCYPGADDLVEPPQVDLSETGL